MLKKSVLSIGLEKLCYPPFPVGLIFFGIGYLPSSTSAPVLSLGGKSVVLLLLQWYSGKIPGRLLPQVAPFSCFLDLKKAICFSSVF